MTAKPSTYFTINQRVSLDQTLTALQAKKLIDPLEANRIRSESGGKKAEIHPLVIVANSRLTVPGRPKQSLDLEMLTRWLARHAGLPFFRVDPMQADVEAITRLVSQTYAQLHRILPVDVKTDHAMVARPGRSPRASLTGTRSVVSERSEFLSISATGLQGDEQ